MLDWTPKVSQNGSQGRPKLVKKGTKTEILKKTRKRKKISQTGAQMDPTLNQIGANLINHGRGMGLEFIRNPWGINWDSYGIRLELICKSDGWFGNVLGMQRDCWEMSVEFIGNYRELFRKHLVFIGNPWDISGDFWLGIHSLGEVQIQTEHIHTHAISLTKPRFPFHVLTGFIFHFFW